MLYTKKGDNGTTKLLDSKEGEKVSKAESIFEALGSLDELNSTTGYAKVLLQKVEFVLCDRKVAYILENVQNLLFILQASIAGSDKKLKEENVFYLESIIAEVEKTLPPIKTFLIPGGTEAGAILDVLRTITRRAERVFVKVIEEGKYNARVGDIEIKFLNRLSSVYYALARYVNYVSGNNEKSPSYA